MRRLVLSCTIGALAAGCGGGPPTIVIHAAGSKLVAVQEGGTWRTLEPDAGTGAVSEEVDGKYLFVVVCPVGQRASWSAVEASSDLGVDEWFHDCAPPVKTRDLNFEISNGSDQVYASFGHETVVATGVHGFADGRHDLYLVDRVSHQVIIRRDLELHAATNVVADFATDAIALTPRNVLGLDPATTYFGGSIASRRGTRVWLGNGAGATFWQLPASATVDGDQQGVELEGRDATYFAAGIPIETPEGDLSFSRPAALSSWSRVPNTAHTTWSAGSWTQVELLIAEPVVGGSPLLGNFRRYADGSGTGDIDAPDFTMLPSWSYNVQPASVTLAVTDRRSDLDYRTVGASD